MGRRPAEDLTKVGLGHQPIRIGLLVNPVMAGSGVAGVPRRAGHRELGAGTASLRHSDKWTDVQCSQFYISLDLGQGVTDIRELKNSELATDASLET